MIPACVAVMRDRWPGLSPGRVDDAGGIVLPATRMFSFPLTAVDTPPQMETEAEMAARKKPALVEPNVEEVQARPPCECGCGGTPKGAKARYLPGHDARHASALKKAAQAEAAE